MSNQESSLFKDALLRLTTNKLSLFSLIYILILVFVALITPFIAPYDYAYQDLELGASPPSPDHLLGTDTLGRDLFSRMIYGSQIVLLIALKLIKASIHWRLILFFPNIGFVSNRNLISLLLSKYLILRPDE